MNLKNAKKVVSAYKTACSDGVPPTSNFDWQPSPIGYKMSDLMLACRMLGTSVEELQANSMPKKEEPKSAPKKAVAKKEEPKKAVVKKEEPKKVVAKKEEPKKAVAKKEEPKKVVSFKDQDGDGTPDYKDKDFKSNSSKSSRPSKSSKSSKSSSKK